MELTDAQRQMVVALAQRHLPNVEIWAYGSRVDGTARAASDLDLAAFVEPGQEAAAQELREAYEQSDLPFRVDLLLWRELPESFQQAIIANHVVLTSSRHGQKS
ncbi:putative DNA polymerase beta domain-containing protein [Magnetofaba australis IT-1]|uniref:Putative DNA polymerase beta domain-containing protein n=2 Tax=Magnetofaba TaxID=1472292 RepID=A0A1Y2KD04_9PROT|nr:putative DNA polymerase beta domain-containing protein [Magnetofaba australis IT-1]